jgi:hypothetical protein
MAEMHAARMEGSAQQNGRAGLYVLARHQVKQIKDFQTKA